MNAADFAAWVALMKATRGWSGRECARRLACGNNQIRIWSLRGAPRHIGLACAALAANLPPWQAPEPSDEREAS